MFGGEGDLVARRVEAAVEVLLCARNGKFLKDGAQNPAVGATGEFDIVQGTVDTEEIAQCEAQGVGAGVAGHDERAVDIPEQKRRRS